MHQDDWLAQGGAAQALATIMAIQLSLLPLLLGLRCSSCIAATLFSVYLEYGRQEKSDGCLIGWCGVLEHAKRDEPPAPSGSTSKSKQASSDSSTNQPRQAASVRGKVSELPEEPGSDSDEEPEQSPVYSSQVRWCEWLVMCMVGWSDWCASQ